MKNLYLSFICILISTIGFSQYYPQGPNAPEVNLQSINNEFHFQLTNTAVGNNYGENYAQYADVDSTAPDQLWRFQGYIVYQVLNSSVNIYETTDTNVIRIAAIVDKLDAISILDYTVYDSITGCESFTLNATNLGIPTTIIISENAFTNQSFNAGESYCFRVFAYASNQYKVHPQCNTADQIIKSTTAQISQIETFCEMASQTVGIVENNKTSITIFPNPVKEVLTINSNSNEDLEVTITTLEGRSVASFSFIETATFNITDYSNGYYFIQIKSANGNLIETRKIAVCN